MCRAVRGLFLVQMQCKKRVSVREDADPFSVSGKKLELASLVSGGRLLSLFSGLVCLPGFRSRRAGGRSLTGKLLEAMMLMGSLANPAQGLSWRSGFPVKPESGSSAAAAVS